MIRVTPASSRRAVDAGIVVAITGFVGVLSGAQQWAGWSPPDSSFYLTLGLFGDQVTDRAIDPSYFWTRLGVIAPIRGLTELLGTWPGLFAYRLLLVALLVAGSYVALRTFTGRPAAAFLTTAWSVSTVVLCFLGNPYPTGAVLAGTTAVMAAGLRATRTGAVVAGLLLGWLLMVNPPGFLLASTVWLVLVVQRGLAARRLALTALAAVLTSAAFVVLGRWMFPRLDWWATVSGSGTSITFSDFVDPEPLWLRDMSLLVPLGATMACAAVWLARRSDHGAQAGLAASASGLGFMLVFSPIMGGVPLQAPLYQAMLWPPTLLGLAMAVTALLPRGSWTWRQAVAGGVTVLVILAAGRTEAGLSMGQSVIIALVALAILVLVVAAAGEWPVAALAAVGVVLASAQVLQNSRPQLGFFYHLTPYVWAFQDNPLEERARAAVGSQEWLLANTSSSDRVSTWVQGDWFAGDRELYEVAAMQLWGPNRVAMEPRMTGDDIARLGEVRPDVIAMFGQSWDGVLTFWTSIPASLSPSIPECTSYAWSPYPSSPTPTTQGYTCLTRLQW